MNKFAIISLGCAKNTVDAEQMLWLLEESGMKNAVNPELADLVIINTCGFIEAAKAEAIENILEMAELKKEGKIQRILVSGCLAERYKEDIMAELPEVDGIVASSALGDIATAAREVLAGTEIVCAGDKDAPLAERRRVLSTPPYSAYIKIAEGCDNRCSYCAIPSIKGKFRSREMSAIVDECKSFAAQGVTELIIVAQDTTRYGLDLYGKRRLSDLLREIAKIDEVRWIRVQYLYPDGFDHELIQVLKTEDKIVKYLDIPIQHASDTILRAMNRRYTRKELQDLFLTLRREIEGLVLRTSLIVGFPGETAADFTALCEFLKEQRIERTGVFAYSQEEGTLAAALEEQVDEDDKAARLEAVYTLQAGIMEAANEALIGTELLVLNEGYDELLELYAGRAYFDAPEVDGRVFFRARAGLPAGLFVPVRVTECMDLDLLGEEIL